VESTTDIYIHRMTLYRAVGVMSGSSCDGLDLCCVDFVRDLLMDSWTFSLCEGHTYPYTPAWRGRLEVSEVQTYPYTPACMVGSSRGE